MNDSVSFDLHGNGGGNFNTADSKVEPVTGLHSLLALFAFVTA